MKDHYGDAFEKGIIQSRQQENPFCKLNDIVYDCIKSAINGLTIQPGDRLNITEIAKTLGVSITPVKNAMQELVREGLVERRESGGYYVFDISEKELTDIYDMRICYEGFAAYLCARRLILVDIDKLRKAALDHKKLWLAYAEGDSSQENYLARMKAEETFNELIIKYADSSTLYRSYMEEKKSFEYALRRYFDYWKIDNGAYGKKIIAEQHLIVVNAIALGIPDIARQAAEEHVQFEKTQCLLRRNRQTKSGYRE